MPLPRGDTARRRRHRRADTGLDACHQLRLHLGGLPRRAGKISVHPARPRGGVRDAGLLWPVADADADHDRTAAQGRAQRSRGRPAAASSRASMPASSAASSDAAAAIRACSTSWSSIALSFHRHAVSVGARRRAFPFVGRDFFPAIDGGQIQLHVRAPAGTRIEATEKIFQEVEDKIREIIPESDRDLIVDNIGLPARAYNLAFADGTTIGVNDGVIMVSLKEGHRPTSEYVRKLRGHCPPHFPKARSIFRRPISSPRSSISACRRTPMSSTLRPP